MFVIERYIQISCKISVCFKFKNYYIAFLKQIFRSKKIFTIWTNKSHKIVPISNLKNVSTLNKSEIEGSISNTGEQRT